MGFQMNRSMASPAGGGKLGSLSLVRRVGARLVLQAPPSVPPRRRLEDQPRYLRFAVLLASPSPFIPPRGLRSLVRTDMTFGESHENRDRSLPRASRAFIRPRRHHHRRYDMAEVRDPSTLETRVIEDWKPLAKDPALRSKLIEINIGEWWPRQKVRLPVTLLAPVDKVCTNLLIENTGLQPKVTVPTGAKLRLLKEHGVGLVFIGMVPITDMEPVGQLHLQMEERFVQTKDTRYTPAWIWGLSDMRALTAAIAEGCLSADESHDHGRLQARRGHRRFLHRR